MKEGTFKGGKKRSVGCGVIHVAEAQRVFAAGPTLTHTKEFGIV